MAGVSRVEVGLVLVYFVVFTLLRNYKDLELRASQLREEIQRNPTSLALHLKFEEALGLLAERQKEIIEEQAKQIEELSKVKNVSLVQRLIFSRQTDALSHQESVQREAKKPGGSFQSYRRNLTPSQA